MLNNTRLTNALESGMISQQENEKSFLFYIYI